MKLELGDRDKEEEKALTRDTRGLERDIKNSKRVVQSQIDILGDVKKFYGIYIYYHRKRKEFIYNKI
jgi:hypothetical protein